MKTNPFKGQDILLPLHEDTVEGRLTVPKEAKGIVLFAHGSGSSRKSPRNQFVSQELNKSGLATLLFDLLTKEEERIDLITAEYRFDIPLITKRLISVTEWVYKNQELNNLNIGYFGASTGVAAALLAAEQRPEIIKAIVSRGGRPDLAENGLETVRAPTLLIVGGRDYAVIQMNESAYRKLKCSKEFLIIPGATHLFEETGKLGEVSEAAKNWFIKHLTIG